MRLLPLMMAAGITYAGIAAAAPETGKPAPAFEVRDTSGAVHRLADYADRTVILEWTNHDCPFVIKHYSSGNMQKLQRDYTGQGVAWLSVISSAPGKQGHVSDMEADQLTASRDAAPSAVLIDESGDMGRAYDAKVTPHMYVIEKGTLRYMGGIDSIPSADVADIESATPYLVQAADAVLAGSPVTNPVTRPYGCSVKY